MNGPPSAFRAMWLLVMFDLPVRSKEQRRRAADFRKFLLEDGYQMLQYSVYCRPCPTEERTGIHHRRVKQALPFEGSVQILAITDRQFGRLEHYLGRKPERIPEQPRQLEFF